MNLRNLLTSQKKVPEQEHFLALEIHESLIKTAVWKIEENEPTIVSLGSFELWDSEESLINGVDASLSSATKGLLEKPTKVILGLPEPWLEDDKIHPTKTKLIKHVLTELGLKPIGLVTSTQAIIHHLKKKEGVPPSAILLEVYPDKVTVAVVKLGKVEALEEVGRSGELNKDVQEGLVRLNIDQLPPRFVLTNGSSLEEEQQQLLSYPWQDKLPFLHLPKVEVLPSEFSIEAIALAGGLEAADSLGIVSEEIDAPKPIAVPKSSDNLSSFGFSVEDSEKETEKEKNSEPNIEPVKQPEMIKEQPETESNIEPVKQPEMIKEPNKPNSKKISFSFFSTFLSSLKTKSTGLNRKSGLVIASVLLLVPIFLTLAYLTLASALVTISVEETTLSETVDINFGGEANPNGLNLPVKTESLTASVSEEISTTGEALVGDKATGTIVLFNRTNDPIIIKSGTIIESDNLTFIISSSDTIASKSADLSDPFNPVEKPGKLDNVSVTATGIGTRYNLSKQTQFSVGTLSRTVLYAVSESDFSGGTSRTVKAVSEEDQEKLLEVASQKVVSEIDSKVKEQDSNLSSLVIGELSYSKKDYSKEVGEEADQISLDLTGQVKVLLYSDSEIINQLTTKLIPKTNSGMKLLQDKTSIEILPPQEIDEDADTYRTQANIEGLLIPVIDQDRYLTQLKGKSVKKLKNILETIPGYKGTKIVIKPNIPFLSNYIPLNKEKVSLIIITSK